MSPWPILIPILTLKLQIRSGELLYISLKNSRIDRYYFFRNKGNELVKTFKRILFSGMSLSLLLLLTGCVGRDKAGNPSGIIWDVLGRPMADSIQFFAKDSGLGYGLAIIIVTLIVRLIIFPLGIYQSWKATLQSEKMNYFKPIFAPIQERINNAETQEEKLAAQQELFAAQRENGLSMFGGIGCLPLIIQTPFFSALFFAAQYTNGVASSTFLGINLGKPSLALTLIVGVLYYIQSLLSLHGIEDETQKEQMKRATYISPITIVGFSFLSPAAVTLYWVVGGFIQIIQQFIINYLMRPRIRKQVAEEYKKNPPKAMSNAGRIKDVTPKASQAITQNNKKKKNRNAGKQRSR